MKRSRLLIATGYLLALLLLILPLLQLVVTLMPPRPEQLRWRLEAFGASSQALLFPLGGFVAAVATAALLEQRRVMRGLAVVCWAGTLGLGLAGVLFALDLLQYGRDISTDLRDYYRAAGLAYLVAFFLAAAFLLWLGTVGWRAAGRRRRRGRRSADPLLQPPPHARSEE